MSKYYREGVYFGGSRRLVVYESTTLFREQWKTKVKPYCIFCDILK